METEKGFRTMNAQTLDFATDHTITVRDERFNRESKPSRWWAGEPFGTTWHNALSGTFPRGEAFFIESVKAFREGAGPQLAAEIRAFVKQESTTRANTSPSTASRPIPVTTWRASINERANCWP